MRSVLDVRWDQVDWNKDLRPFPDCTNDLDPQRSAINPRRKSHRDPPEQPTRNSGEPVFETLVPKRLLHGS
jgi:hypothetical protein